MSRHTVPALAPAGRHGITELVAGWDRPLQQWFAFGKRDGELVWEWSGSSLDRLNEAADEIGLRLPISLLQRLQEDGQQDAGNTITQFPGISLEKQPELVVNFTAKEVLEVIEHSLTAKAWAPTLLLVKDNGEPLYAKPQPGVILSVAPGRITLCSNATDDVSAGGLKRCTFALGFDPSQGRSADIPETLTLPLEHVFLQPRLDELVRWSRSRSILALAVSDELAELAA